MSQDSLTNAEQDNNNNIKTERPSSTTNSKLSSKMSTFKSTTNGLRSIGLNEHIKLVKQKKEEAEILRLQRFQEQLRKKEQKWQQQQLERVKKWLQLRNRDTDHRSQVEERRKKREEEAKAKIDELVRREKEREQKITLNLRTNVSHKPDSVMSMSTDVVSTRRAISASRLRSNHQDLTNRRGSNDSSAPPTSHDNTDSSHLIISSHQLNSIDEQQDHHLHDATMTIDESSFSGTPQPSARSQTRPMPTSYVYWLKTGDNNNQNNSSNFMRLTYAATCRSRLSRSVERCPRSCRAHHEVTNDVPTNGESQQSRIQNANRQHLTETIRRLAKPRNVTMTQSIHIGATTNGLPLSRSSHQLRIPTPPVTTNHHSTPTITSLNSRRHVPSRSTTVSSSNTESQTDESSRSDHRTASSRQSSHRSATHSKVPFSSTKPPTLSSHPKPPVKRSVMSTSYSSSSLSSATTTNKQNIRRIGGISPSKQKPTTSIPTPESQLLTDDREEEHLPVNEDTNKEEESPAEIQESIPSVEPINIDIVTEIINSTASTAAPISKREQQAIDQQEYQRKLNQKIREAQQRLEVERQREEERQRQLELEEYEREQEQIHLVEEQRRAEQERLQRAIEEREREDELKRQEEQRLQQQREELERRQAEEADRLNRERQERAKKEEDERNERKKRLDLIMRRTRQISPNSKQENNANKTPVDQSNGHDQPQSSNNVFSPTTAIKSSIPHSISDNRFPSSSSSDNFLVNNNSVASPTTAATTDTPKFKSPLIQSLLNKARNTRSTDNLAQTSMTASQIMTESMIDDATITAQSTTPADLSDDDDDDDDHHQENSRINNNTNGHTDLRLSSSSNMNSYHERPMEAATASQ